MQSVKVMRILIKMRNGQLLSSNKMLAVKEVEKNIKRKATSGLRSRWIKNSKRATRKSPEIKMTW